MQKICLPKILSPGKLGEVKKRAFYTETIHFIHFKKNMIVQPSFYY